MQKMKMKYTNVILILITMLALIFITIEAQETGATGTNDSAGRSGATGTDEAKIENEKKMEMQHTVANVKKNAVREIKGIVDTAISETKKYASEQKQACTVEEAAAIQWSKEADPVATEAARKERKKAKEELLSAIEYRQKVLKKFLDKLYAARYTLGDSIHRTNNIYFSAYDANVQTQVITRNALKNLGIAFEHKNSGALGVFHPIKLPNLHDDEVQEEAAEKKEGIAIDQPSSETSASEADETEIVKQELEFTGISKSEVENNKEEIANGIAESLGIPSDEVITKSSSSSTSTGTTTTTIKTKMESTQFKSSLKSKIAAATKVESSKINVAQKKTWVETEAKKTTVEAPKEGTKKEEEKVVLSTTVAPTQKEEKAKIIATNKTPEEKKDIATTVAPKSHIQGEKEIIETTKEPEKADTATKAPIVTTKKSGEWQDICKAGLGLFSQESLDSHWLQTLKFRDKDGDGRISFYEFFHESEGVSKTEACFKHVHDNSKTNPGHASTKGMRKLCHKVEEVWNKYAGNDGKLDMAQNEKFGSMLIWEGMYDTMKGSFDRNGDGNVTLGELGIKMCPADAARKADEEKVCNMMKSYIKAHTTEGSKIVSKEGIRQIFCQLANDGHIKIPDNNEGKDGSEFLEASSKMHFFDRLAIFTNHMKSYSPLSVTPTTKRDDMKLSLMEIEAQVHQKMSSCVGEECNPTMQGVWILHKMAFDIDCANYKIFDVEQRTPLTLYREGLKRLIDVREKKIKALEKQAAELRASLADPGQTLAELFPLIDQHIKIQDVACKKMPINTEKMLRELEQIQGDIAQGNFHCMIDTGGEGENYKIPNEKTPTGSTGPAATAEPKEEEKPAVSTS